MSRLPLEQAAEFVEVDHGAQQAWASLGGLGPVPPEVARYYLYKEVSPDAEVVARRLITQQRFELRLRFIERALPATIANAHAHRVRGSGLIVDGESTTIADWAATSAIGDADAVLSRLAAEAQASIQAPSPEARLETLRARDDAHRLADDLRSTVRSVTAPNDRDRLDYEASQRIAELLEQLRDRLAERGSP